MKKLSIKAKIALMCTLLAAMVTAFALFVVLYNEHRVIQSYFSDSLAATAQLADDDIRIENGSLEIDRNLDDLPSVRVAVFSLDGDLIYGQQRFELQFEDGSIREVREESGVQWILQDTCMHFQDGTSIWLRCYMPSDALQNMRGVRREVLLALFPVLILLAALGGWLVARRALRPLAGIIRTANGIADGSDLKKRISPGGAQDEIYQTARVFDDMLERLDEAFERERRFTADVSHELRTPVAGIAAHCDFALSDAASDADRREALLEIRQQGRHISDLIQRLLSLARLDARQKLGDMEAVDLALLAEITAETIAAGAEDRGMRVEVVSSGKPVVKGDQTMLIQAALNLAENAVNYGRECGVVRIGAQQTGDVCKLFVCDDGPGIAEKDQKYIFDRFYQADASRHSRGFGLGLSLVKRIIQLHGGWIELESAPGKGSCFALVLPAWAEREGSDEKVS